MADNLHRQFDHIEDSRLSVLKRRIIKIIKV